MLSITCPPVADGISHVRCRAGTLSAQGGKAHSIDKEPVCLLGSKTSRFKLQAIEVHTDLARKTLRATTPHLPESWFSFKISQDLKFAGCGFTPVYWCSKWALDFEGLIFCHSGNVGPPPDPQQLQMPRLQIQGSTNKIGIYKAYLQTFIHLFNQVLIECLLCTV